jgi:Tol biopolymer transport system component
MLRIYTSTAMSTGIVHRRLQIVNTQYRYRIMKWLDKTYAYVIAFGRYHGKDPLPPTILYLLNVPVNTNSLKEVLAGVQGDSGQFDSSPDGKQLFVVQQTESDTIIWVEPATGGTRQVISRISGTSPQIFITQMRVSATSLLLTIYSDYAHKGCQLWRMALDGSDHTILFSTTDYTQHDLNRMTQYAWSNVSRDETMLALEAENPDLGIPTLLVSPLQEGKATKFEVFPYNATSSVGTSYIVGWTTIS